MVSKRTQKATRQIVASIVVDGVGTMQKKKRMQIVAYCDAVHNEGRLTKATRAQRATLKVAKAVIIGNLVALSVYALVQAGAVTISGTGAATTVTLSSGARYGLGSIVVGFVRWEAYICHKLIERYGNEIRR